MQAKLSGKKVFEELKAQQKSLDLVGQGEREGRRRKQELSASKYYRCWANLRCQHCKHYRCWANLRQCANTPNRKVQFYEKIQDGEEKKRREEDPDLSLLLPHHLT
jgi:hypothetical protein